jgi:hypothetical protein
MWTNFDLISNVRHVYWQDKLSSKWEEKWESVVWEASPLCHSLKAVRDFRCRKLGAPIIGYSPDEVRNALVLFLLRLIRREIWRLRSDSEGDVCMLHMSAGPKWFTVGIRRLTQSYDSNLSQAATADSLPLLNVDGHLGLCRFGYVTELIISCNKRASNLS